MNVAREATIERTSSPWRVRGFFGSFFRKGTPGARGAARASTDFGGDFRAKLRCLAALGPGRVARVASYRLGLRTGLHPVLRLEAQAAAAGPFFERAALPPPGAVARAAWRREAEFFGRPLPFASEPPDWFAHPLAPGKRAEADAPWSDIADFDPDAGDVKVYWEWSRLEWAPALAQQAAMGEKGALRRLNHWLEDWAARNPPYRGVNWKCGQEAGIRVMNLALAALMLGRLSAPTPGLTALLRAHLARIAPTMGYAVGQANNHAVSEAVALYVGGAWLSALGIEEARSWRGTGRRRIEWAARALFGPDGGFSQYSTNYHRVALDALALAELWRRRMADQSFSAGARACFAAAAEWLRAVTDPETGGAPNLGANDSARLLPLSDCPIEDFRPAVQRAQILFWERAAYEPGPWDRASTWLGLARPKRRAPPPGSASFDQFGLHVLRRGRAAAFLRYPRARFRPSQADALHLDLWADGVNLVRDAGTLAYSDPDEIAYFGATRGHATVELDGRDQMPRLSRFLFGEWLDASSVEPVRAHGEAIVAQAGYRDWKGGAHTRKVTLFSEKLLCEDHVSGFSERAVLRWRLPPGPWRLDGSTLGDGRRAVTIASDVPIARLELERGREARRYLEAREIPVLEAEIREPGAFTTEIAF